MSKRKKEVQLQIKKNAYYGLVDLFLPFEFTVKTNREPKDGHIATNGYKRQCI